ncbi:DNA polymerase III subunit gamma/tau [Candidatus Daviesbacteria bacterium]|nr:DNA polymerase III subunit gamma/tau [Candidatus Daviesbacteria bacterium]
MQDTKSAFYLKYRPQSLNDLIGQETVKKILQSAFSLNRLSHAYIFVGPRGTGKTSTARILAKMVNCEKGKALPAGRQGESGKSELPCNSCSACLSITDGTNLDLIEIDAASNRGIDDIRSLRERINLAPTNAKKKVYIIDEVHMLTTEAFNALLKTLEEPPAHALFILATTEGSKVPQTILSRCIRLDFKLASQQELVQVLSIITKEEKIEIDEDSIKIVAQKADGSFRDGVKLLDQVSSWSGKITAVKTQESLRSSKFEQTTKVLEHLSLNSTKEALLEITNQTKEGIDTKGSITSLMEAMRHFVFIKSGLVKELVEPFWGEEKTKVLISLSEKFDTGALIKNLDLLQTALEKLKTSSIEALPLELAVVQMCRYEPESAVMNRESEDLEILPVTSEINIPVSETKLVMDKSAKEPKLDGQDMSDLSKVKEKWNFVLETVRQNNFSLEALLRSVELGDCSGSTVVIKVPYSFHQRILDAPKNRELVEAIISDILGRSIKITTSVGIRRPRKEDIANIEVAADDEVIRIASEIFSSETVN